MVTPKTGRPRGRPHKDFIKDPDRFAIALACAFKAVGTSENDAYRAVAALAFGTWLSAEDVDSRHKPGRGAMPSGSRVTYERAARKGGASGSLQGRATSLRQKASRLGRDPRDMAWLLQMQSALALAVQAATSVERCANRILELGQLVVEGKLAEAELLNVLSAELPDLFTNDPRQG
jgi:hypothetical protein